MEGTEGMQGTGTMAGVDATATAPPLRADVTAATPEAVAAAAWEALGKP